MGSKVDRKPLASEDAGCPATGFYGSNCSIPCPDVNCQYCHIETGYSQCCKPGYQGQRCELECDKGSYGLECNGTCGYCRDINQCSNVNGTCLTGCEAGYEGDLCKTHFVQNEKCCRYYKYLVDPPI
uniref:Multiple epidermal growth factor-like domains 10 n=1 Tax=Magallana gigas TaxID=29159 RepID=K1QME5_MAGGI